MATTAYTLFVQTEKDGEFVPTDYKRSKKGAVIAEAEKRRATEKVGVSVRTETGTEVFFGKKPNKRVITRFTKPYTLTIDLGGEDLVALVPEGYVPAYHRPRNEAFVLRNDEKKGTDEFYLVLDHSGNELGFAMTTRAAGALMKGAKAAKVKGAKDAENVVETVSA
jgi:hypothetical protein